MTSPLDTQTDPLLTMEPARSASVRELFGVDSDMQVPVFAPGDPHVPELDPSYQFDPATTLAIEPDRI